MHSKTTKLAHKLGMKKLAGALVEAGLDTPAKIKGATDAQIKAIPGVGPATVKKIRQAFPKQGLEPVEEQILEQAADEAGPSGG